MRDRRVRVRVVRGGSDPPNSPAWRPFVNRAELKPGTVVCGPVFPEPVEILVVQPLGSNIKSTGAGKSSGQARRVRKPSSPT